MDRDARWCQPEHINWDAHIEVPFSPETAASGIGDTGFYKACWYRRMFEKPEMSERQRVLLHFGAVDYAAVVWVNGNLAIEHEGGYTPFCVDITEMLASPGPQTVVVRAYDDPADLSKPR